ncbi:hypothetical protein ERO13_D12G165000v2 [Gossypium hirsutum]|uniref:PLASMODESMATA CALLOSE-BINDING PROTEIN 3 n=5 Tax=Gossypium TaxID=3633 RepID=A0A1U8NAT5_GOSHI|nr:PLASMODESMATA CALLOSE-BINDING PROTEIN 3 [Gossypium raimondii]XP_016736166.1 PLASMODESMATA CALLOSE-BINDING PROTEIN 3-like [Gossypium hirsutum]KAB1999761.1 hypothetical protein ES319_D12G183200v1 [Gossypium barbadense]TYG41663.1 hypothetical protein ES288_D12G193400v1 [Gossypium darwinii]TYI51576.1 hypothetical protein E1A91_D12G185900v1 [Gossypium mustelinum]KAG4116363.1 hypothetical protein ERO13_D12G165000v2 [Gossypium hirsutum]KJB50578.1 hypothetical protein B456_008G177700 [Gossypium ra
MVPFIYVVLFLAMSGHSSANYCLCKDGVNEQTLQKTLDYACGAGADCTPINQNGPCYNPNTVKDHCNYAVNSYFQKKGQAQGSCDFSGTATVSVNPPSNIPSTCSFPSSGTSTTPSTGTPTTPTTGTPTSTPTTGTPTTPTTGTPTTGTPTTPTTGTPTTGTSTGIPSTTPTTGTTTGSPTVFGGGTTSLGPSGTTTGINDPSHAVTLFTSTNNNILFTLAVTLWILAYYWA